jgi:integrase
MATAKLTKRVVDEAVSAGATLFLYDTDLKGFGLKVTASGTKTFVVEYRPGSGGRGAPKRRMTLGKYGALTTEEARGLAKNILARVHAGEDPAQEKIASRSEMTIGELCDTYITDGCETKKASTVATDRGRIERHIKPLLGKKKVKEISRADIERFMRDVAAGKTAADIKTIKRGRAIVEGGRGTATRTVGLLGGIMTFAVDRGLRPDNPVRGVKRYTDKKGERFLSSSELAQVGMALATAAREGANPKAIAIIQLLALTGARKSEIAGLKWQEVDLERGYLRLGDSKTGAKALPVGAPAREVLASQPRIGGTEYVFPAASGGGHFQGVEKVWRQVRAAAGFDTLRLHDLRHSFASVGLARGDTLAVIGAILGHADVKTTSRYAHLADDPVRTAADGIAQAVHAAMGGGPIPSNGAVEISNVPRPAARKM